MSAHEHKHLHEHRHGHDSHGHCCHHDARGLSRIRLIQAMFISLVITVAQVIGGIISGSLALISDALHTATDAIALVISYIALKLSDRPGTDKHTFGLKRAEIIAATLNAAVLIAISLWLIQEAVHRFINPQPISGAIMVGVAAIGLFANIICSFLLHRSAKENINMRSAYLHVLSDAAVSVGVIIGGFAIMFWKVTWIDPALTLLISIWLICASGKILRQAVDIFMMAAPSDVSLDDVEQLLTSLDGVHGVHHIHLWQLDDKARHFEAHLEISDRLVSESGALLDTIEQTLHKHFDINHVTIQFETQRCRDTQRIVQEG